ncbi:MAG: hypothetical protein QG670_2491 [Thermoproteota archaeon]|nr:hypothetical protein [Thermoproteota archaeon]
MVAFTNSPHHSLVDLIIALKKLAPSDKETINAIMETLGIFFEPESSNFENSKDLENVSKSSKEVYEQLDSSESILPSPPSDIPISNIPRSEIFSESDKPVVPFVLTPPKKSETNFPAWFYNPLPLKNIVNPRDHNPKNPNPRNPFTSYPLLTLFNPILTRSILVSTLSILDNIGPLDTDEVLRLVSRNEPIKEIPRLPSLTTVHGVQVLVDESETLEPFNKDQINLRREIRKIVGSDKVQILGFLGCPLRGVRRGIFDSWSEYSPPPRRTTVLLLTDLGILRDPYILDHVGVDEWLRFASIIRKAGCSLVAFVPYPKERWPKMLQSSMRIIQWDRTTVTTRISQIKKNNCGLKEINDDERRSTEANK